MTSVPSLKRVVVSIKETRSELNFQVERLSAISSDTPAEREHLNDLKNGYGEAFRYLGILLRYQEGRLRRHSENEEEMATL